MVMRGMRIHTDKWENGEREMSDSGGESVEMKTMVKKDREERRE